MLYNFLAKLLPFGLSFFITGMIFLLLQIGFMMRLEV